MARLDSLQALEPELWRELERAVADKSHAWRTPVLATVNGDAAEARTVILREVDVRQKQLTIYTDERAGKVAQLMRHPQGTLLMWSPALSWQLRCRVRLTVQTSGLAATSRWARIKLSPAAQDYLSPLPPGAVLDTAPPVAPDGVPRSYFAVVEAEVQSIDWLELLRNGHRRAVFSEIGARWLQP